MEEELEGNICIDNYLQNDVTQKTERITQQPFMSLDVVDTLPQENGNWSKHKPSAAEHLDYLNFDENPISRAKKQLKRKKALAKKCAELAIITGGEVFFRLLTPTGNSFVFCSNDHQWNEYCNMGLQPQMSDVRMDGTGKETTVNKKDGMDKCVKPKTESKVKEKVKKESITNTHGEEVVRRKVGRPKLIDTKPKIPIDQGKESEGKSTESKSPDLKSDLQKKKSIKRLKVTPAAHIMHLDPKFVISAPSFQTNQDETSTDNSTTNENAAVNSIPILIIPEEQNGNEKSTNNAIKYSIHPSLVHSSSGQSSTSQINVDRQLPSENNEVVLVPLTAVKRKRKRTKIDDSIEEKVEKIEVFCNVCKETYNKRQDNRRYGRWIGCSKCPIWVHAKCVSWSEEDIDSEKEFFCSECREKNSTTNEVDNSVSTNDTINGE